MLRRWYRATLAGGIVLLLLATLPLWLFDSASIGQWLMHALPLVLLLPGVAQCRRRSLATHRDARHRQRPAARRRRPLVDS